MERPEATGCPSWIVRLGGPLEFALRGAGASFVDRIDAVPPLAGAYILWLELDCALPVVLSGGRGQVLGPGVYFYFGSARGPGGLRARVGRHMRQGKAVRWHVDQLTERGRVVGAWVVPGGDECALRARFAGCPVPLPGFGSSDCRRCPSHLVAWPAGSKSDGLNRSGGKCG